MELTLREKYVIALALAVHELKAVADRYQEKSNIDDMTDLLYSQFGAVAGLAESALESHMAVKTRFPHLPSVN